MQPTLADYFHRDGITARLATPDDFPALVPLINHAFAYQDDAKGDVRIDFAGINQKSESSDFYLWQDADGNIIACCYLKALTITLYFGLLSVTDEYRGSGLAPAIIEAIEAYARATGKAQLRLDYMSLSPWLKTYYERYGFSETGVVRDIEWARLIRMQKPLR